MCHSEIQGALKSSAGYQLLSTVWFGCVFCHLTHAVLLHPTLMGEWQLEEEGMHTGFGLGNLCSCLQAATGSREKRSDAETFGQQRVLWGLAKVPSLGWWIITSTFLMLCREVGMWVSRHQHTQNLRPPLCKCQTLFPFALRKCFPLRSPLTPSSNKQPEPYRGRVRWYHYINFILY